MDQLIEYFGDELQYTAFHPEPTKKPKPAEFGKYSLYEATLKSWNKEGYGVYFTVNKVKPGSKRTEEYIEEARAIWLEDDGDKHGKTDPTKFPLAPSMVIESSPGKHHYYWFTSTKNLDEWQSVIDKLAVDYNGDPGGTLKTQVLRIPGYHNTKYKNNNLVSITGGNFRVYGWGKVKEAFPPGQKATKLPEHKPKLDIAECVHEIVSGESIYPNCEKLTMSFANAQISRDKSIDVITGILLASQADQSRINNAKIKLDSLVTSALGKVARERVTKFKPDDVGAMYTHLDWPPGFVGEVARDVYKSMPYPSIEISIATAFHAVSILGCGCYHYKRKSVSRARTILAQTGRGKQSAADYFYEVVNSVAVPECAELFVTTPSHSAFNNHMDMNKQKCRSMIISEAGIAKTSQVGDRASIRQWILQVLSLKVGKAPLVLTARSKGNVQNSHNEQHVKPIRDPVFCLLDESVPDTYIDQAQKEQHEESGALARSELYFIAPEHEYNENHSGDVNPDILDKFTALITQYMASGCTDGTDPNYKSSQMIEVNFDLVKEDMLAIVKDIEARQGDGIHRSLYTRLHEKIVVSCIVLAVADSLDISSTLPGIPVVTKGHFEYAKYMHTELNRALIANATKGHLASAMEQAMRHMEECLGRVVQGDESESDREFVTKNGNDYVVNMRWMARKFRAGRKPLKQLAVQFFNNERKARQEIIENAIEQGMLIRKSKDLWIVNL